MVEIRRSRLEAQLFGRSAFTRELQIKEFGEILPAPVVSPCFRILRFQQLILPFREISVLRAVRRRTPRRTLGDAGEPNTPARFPAPNF